MRGTSHDPAIKQINNTRSTPGMSKGLQTYARRDTENGATVKPVTLILNSKYIEPLTDYINEAKSEIRIFAYLWRWYENNPEEKMQKFNTALIRAHLRGVKCMVICDNSTTKDILKNNGIKVKSVDSKQIMHMKAVLIDEKMLALGSHNFSKYAMERNIEASVFISEFEPIQQFKTYFDGMWGQLSEN